MYTEVMKKIILAAILCAVLSQAASAQTGRKGVRISMEELSVQNGENLIYGKVFFPKDEEKHPAIILSHGYNGSHSDFIDDCRFFAQNGYVAYCYDFCGGSTRSRSSGRTADMSLLTEKSDLIAVINHFETMDNVDRSRIYLLGGSQGGLVSALAAEEVPQKVKAMALYFPAFCIPDDWRKKFPGGSAVPESLDFWGMTLGKDFLSGAVSMNVDEATGRYGGNVLIIHGDSDDIVPLRYSQEAVKRYPHAKLEVMPGERHGFSPAAAARARKMVLQFTESN